MQIYINTYGNLEYRQVSYFFQQYIMFLSETKQNSNL
jgi:hypothetical protein